MINPDVIAAVPNYNMADSLHVLLPTLLEQEYAGVFVLDDASTDHSADVVRELGSDVQFVAGQENVGAGGNRNRILGILDRDVIIHFVDADMRVETERMPEIARELAADPSVAFTGGLIKKLGGLPHHFNYGPRQCIRNDPFAALQDYLGHMAETDPERAHRLWQRYGGHVAKWPNPFETPQEKTVFWAAESNFIIPSATLRAVGGYDPMLRDHEVQDLAIRLEALGLKRKFNPVISMIHTAVQVRSGNRNREMLKAAVNIHLKHGARKYFFPPKSALTEE